ncbi:MAG TPA: hypothetical protein VKA06_10660 [Spirochaetia bacterium]|nr:hypothetical protein [Spirochaetia bacterium]
MEAEPRAEELILDVYRQRSEALTAGRPVSRVIMSRRHYELIQSYRARLGEMAEGGVDYLDRYRLFDLDICVEREAEISVE